MGKRTSNRTSAFVVDYDKTEGAREREKNPPPKPKPQIDFYVDTPHRSRLVAAEAAEAAAVGPVRRALRALLHRT